MNETSTTSWLFGVELLLGSRALFDELHRRLAAAGHEELRPAHGFLFQAVGAGATASELASRLGVSKQAVAPMMEELIKGGYLERRTDVTDRRRRPVQLAPRGAQVLRRSQKILDELRAELEAELGPADLRAVSRLLETLERQYGPAPLRPVW